MRTQVMTMMMAAFLAVACAVPAFAHCHGGSRQPAQSCADVCEAYCEDGFLCGEDGHYCADHRDGDACEGYGTCEPVRRSSHHHHGRHH